MKLLRFMFPFLFVRNWYDGTWEISRVRLFFFVAFLVILLVGMGIVYVLNAPVTYSALTI